MPIYNQPYINISQFIISLYMLYMKHSLHFMKINDTLNSAFVFTALRAT